jgi:hypothetical protein
MKRAPRRSQPSNGILSVLVIAALVSTTIAYKLDTSAHPPSNMVVVMNRQTVCSHAFKIPAILSGDTGVQLFIEKNTASYQSCRFRDGR